MCDLLLNHEIDQLRPEALLRTRQDQTCACQKCGCEFWNRGVEAQGWRKLQHSARRRNAEARNLRSSEFGAPQCATATPFGLPVDPEV